MVVGTAESLSSPAILKQDRKVIKHFLMTLLPASCDIRERRGAATTVKTAMTRSLWYFEAAARAVRLRMLFLLAFSMTLGAALAIVLLLVGAGISAANAQSMSTPAPAAASSALTAAQIKAETAWQRSILQTSRSGVGCFKAQYPAISWQSVPCSKASAARKPLIAGVAPADVGNGGNDYGLQVSTHVYRMKGSFDSITGLTSITGGNGSASNFALQLNASPFVPPACQNALVPGKCSGTVQFIYSNKGQVYIEYWLFHYAKGCPQYWGAYYDGCFFNSPIMSVPVLSLSNLKNLVLYADADLTGDYDYATIQTAPGLLYSASYHDNVLSLSKFWSASEFNIVGDQAGSETFLNNGVTIGVRLSLPFYGAGDPAPACVLSSSFSNATSEYNNLDISSHCKADANSITFQESKTPTSGQPIIAGFSPHSGYATGSTSVTLTGFHFKNVKSVTFGGTPVTFTTPSDNEIDIAHAPPCSPLGCPNGGALIEASGGAQGGLTGSDYIGPFQEVPYVQSITPPDGSPGAQVTVTGNGFFNPDTPVFYFGSVQAQNVYCPPATRNTQCTMNAPIQDPNGVHVTFGSITGASAAIWIYNGLNSPYIDSVNPPSGPQAGGTTVVITGSGFTQQMEAAFGSTYIGITGDCPTSTQCTVQTPRSATADSVPVSVGGYAEGSPFSPPNAKARFDYLAPPPSGSLSPSTGVPAGGTVITIGLTGFDAYPGSVVDFNFGGKTTRIYNATCQLNPANPSNSYCTLQTPPLPSTMTPPTAVPVSVNYNGSTLAVGNFTYEAPVLVPGSISPNIGPVTGGTNITVHVNNFLAAAGAVVNFSFNGTPTEVPNSVCTVDAGNTGNSTCTATTLPLPAGETTPAEIPVSVTAQGKSVTVGNFQYGHKRPPPTQCEICRENGGICSTKNGKFICAGLNSPPTGSRE